MPISLDDIWAAADPAAEERELFPLSWLSQYGYCPRRCGLLAIDCLWADNSETASGTAQHRRVHTARVERRGGRIDIFELSVFSRRLGVSGKCDCVEAAVDEHGVALPYGDALYSLYPVEYKHGVVRSETEYNIQLCAQAMCLEERFGGEIPAGAIYYMGANRRSEVRLTPQLRELTVETARAVSEMIAAQQAPPASYGAKCRRCSMLEDCQPKLKTTARAYCGGVWRIALGEEKI